MEAEKSHCEICDKEMNKRELRPLSRVDDRKVCINCALKDSEQKKKAFELYLSP